MGVIIDGGGGMEMWEGGFGGHTPETYSCSDVYVYSSDSKVSSIADRSDRVHYSVIVTWFEYAAAENKYLLDCLSMYADDFAYNKIDDADTHKIFMRICRNGNGRAERSAYMGLHDVMPQFIRYVRNRLKDYTSVSDTLNALQVRASLET